jgi:hypothetical protein
MGAALQIKPLFDGQSQGVYIIKKYAYYYQRSNEKPHHDIPAQYLPPPFLNLTAIRYALLGRQKVHFYIPPRQRQFLRDLWRKGYAGLDSPGPIGEETVVMAGAQAEPAPFLGKGKAGRQHQV